MAEAEKIPLTCPKCNTKLRIKSYLAGKSIACPSKACGKPVKVPMPTKNEYFPVLLEMREVEDPAATLLDVIQNRIGEGYKYHTFVPPTQALGPVALAEAISEFATEPVQDRYNDPTQIDFMRRIEDPTGQKPIDYFLQKETGKRKFRREQVKGTIVFMMDFTLAGNSQAAPSKLWEAVVVARATKENYKAARISSRGDIISFPS